VSARYACLTSKSEQELSYGKRLKLVDKICNFIFKGNYFTQTPNREKIKHTETDILTIRALVLDFTSKNQMTNPTQETIGEKIGRHKDVVGKALKRLEAVGFIYTIKRTIIKEKTSEKDGKTRQSPENASLGYCLTPDLSSRIYRALKSGRRDLASANLLDKLQKIILSAAKIIRKYRSGDVKTEYITPKESLMAKKDRIVKTSKAYFDKEKQVILNKPDEECTLVDKVIKDHLRKKEALSKAQSKPVPEPVPEPRKTYRDLSPEEKQKISEEREAYYALYPHRRPKIRS